MGKFATASVPLLNQWR